MCELAVQCHKTGKNYLDVSDLKEPPIFSKKKAEARADSSPDPSSARAKPNSAPRHHSPRKMRRGAVRTSSGKRFAQKIQFHRQKTKSDFRAEIGSRRRRDTNAFPPPNSESKRVFHAPRGSKSTVRSKILKFEPTFLNSRKNSSGIPSFANSILFILAFRNLSVSSNRL